jgi:VWFA-related protein
LHTRLVAPIVLAVTAAVAAQQPPTFRAEINYVELPVRVLDGKGNFIRDLARGDFQIFEDGKPQTIADFTLIDLPLPARGMPLLSAVTEGVPSPVAGPAAPEVEGRLYLIVLDDLRVRPQYSSQLKRVAGGFIRDHMGAGDVAGIVFTSGIRGQDFTADRTLLVKAIDAFVGRADADIPRLSISSPYGAPLDDELAGRATLKTIADISKSMAAVKRRRKAVIYVSVSLGCAVARQLKRDTPPPIAEGNMASEGESGRLNAPTTLCAESIWTTVRAATQSDVSVYSIDPRGLQNPYWVSPKIDGRGGPDRARDKMTMVEGGPRNLFDGMRVLADSTGGFVVDNVNDFDKAFDRIVRENSSYYLLGYYTTNDRADGKSRKNEVKLGRKGVQVLYRASYIAPRN